MLGCATSAESDRVWHCVSIKHAMSIKLQVHWLKQQNLHEKNYWIKQAAKREIQKESWHILLHSILESDQIKAGAEEKQFCLSKKHKRKMWREDIIQMCSDNIGDLV